MGTPFFPLLFSPIKVGKVTLRNRIVFLPHSNNFPAGDLPGERELYYFGERAQGGVGLIIYGGQFVHRIGDGSSVSVTNPKVMDHYKRIADRVHQYGAFISAQLTHRGATQFFGDRGLDWTAPYGPSTTAAGGTMVREMEYDDIQRIIEAYAIAARRVVTGGFDGIEIRLNAGLVQDFTSVLTNKRTDDYGGTLEKRLRFALEITNTVRTEVGPDVLIDARICVNEVAPGGHGIKEGQEIARLLAATGEVDFINTGVGLPGSVHMMGVYPLPLGYGVEPAASVKKAVDIPVVAQGRVNEPAQAEAILAQGKGDLIGMARGLIADPEFPNKAQAGHVDDIRKCFGYHDVCQGRNAQRLPITCVWNPAAGREKQLGIGTLRQADQKKRVLVIGAGPAGLKISEVAARRGHQVALYERADELGGQINLAVRLPYRDHLAEISSHFSHQLEKLGVDIKKRVEVTPEVAVVSGADVVVVATGSLPLVPNVPGFDQDNVVTYWDVARDLRVKGDTVLVYDWVGHWAAAGIVELLASQGKKVYLVTPHRTAVSQIQSRTLLLWEQRTAGKGVVRLTDTNVRSIRGRTVTLASSLNTGEERTLEGIDTLILACGGRPNDAVYSSLKQRLKDVRMVGDCEAPQRIENAIYSAELLARAL